jgi:hypothetical protein
MLFGSFGAVIFICIFGFSVVLGFVIVWMVCDFLESETNGRCIKSFLSGRGIAEDGECNVVGGIVVFVLLKHMSASIDL